MRFLKRVCRLSAGVWCAASLAGQNIPRPAAKIAMSGYDARGSGLPANSPSTLLPFTVEGDATGENVFHVVTSNPAVIVSLILPSGVEITGSNAFSFGFTYTVMPDNTGADVQSVLSLPGTHTLIQIPGGQVSGVYSIKANASSVNTDSGIIASYYPSSNVRTAITSNSSSYKVGDTVVLSGLVFDSATPIMGATVTAGVSAPLSLAGQTSIGNYQLVSQQSVAPNLTEYQYTATLTNTGSAVREVQAGLASTPQNLIVVNDVLLFGNIAANSTTTSTTNLIIQRDPTLSFDLTTLQWNVTATGSVVNVNLTDSGLLDSASGDGVYTGTFIPSSPGIYTAFLSVTGSSLAGNNFSRSAIFSFKVTAQQLAGLTGFADTQQSTGITTTATVNVVTPGMYRLSMQMRASNQNITSRSVTANLAAGSQQIALMFSNSQMFSLGVNGPYERVNALLVYMGSSGDSIADSRADAGPTAAYSLSSFAPPLYFTGQNSAAGVVTGSGPTLDLLRVTMGVFNATSRSCDWNGRLTDLSGNEIDFNSAGGTVAAGATSVTLDFNGNKIARAMNGPYLVKNVTIHCGTDQAQAQTLFQTQNFTASQFTLVAADFTLSATSPASGGAGSTFNFGVTATSIGAFEGTINLAVGGLPTGASGTFAAPTIIGFGTSFLVVTTTSSTPAGSYTLTFTGTSGTLSHTAPATLTILAQVATPAFSPAAGAYTSTQSVTISTTTPSAAIRYTTDGSTPTSTVGILYGGAITVGSDTTVKAIAYKTGMIDSAVSSATYTFAPSIVLDNPPISGSGPSRTFDLAFKDLNGAGNIQAAEAAIVTAPGSNPACVVLYGSGWFYLVNDAGTGWIGPIPAGANISIENSSCVLAAPSISTSGTQLTLHLHITFRQAFAGAKQIWMFVQDVNGLNSGWSQDGNWTASFLNQAPSINSLTPVSGSGMSGTFTGAYTDPNGVGNIQAAELAIVTSLGTNPACVVVYGSSLFFLVNDAGSGLLGPIVTGSGGSLQNSACTLTAPTVAFSGNQVTLSVPITFKAAFAGSKQTWMFVQDVNGLNSGWSLRGFWTVQ